MKHVRDKIGILRREYAGRLLDEQTVDKNPLKQFAAWMHEALEAKADDPHAMILATADKHGKPSLRTVLLRDFNEKGFVFFTNYNSRKGKEISENPQGSVLFYWPALQRQVRVEGVLEKINPADSETYFKSRPAASQVSAWVSPQSAEIENKTFLDEQFNEFAQKFKNKPVPYPAFWGGFCLRPQVYEFWQGQVSRLHDRVQYALREDGTWKIARLAP